MSERTSNSEQNIINMDLPTIFYIAWGLQAAGIAIVGDGRKCGLMSSFLMSLICGPLAGMLLVLTSDKKPPMPQ